MLETLDDTFCEFDLYTSRPSDTRADRFHYSTMSLWKQPRPKFLLPSKPTSRVEATTVDKNGRTQVKSRPVAAASDHSSSQSVDSDIEALALSLAQEKDRKSQNVYAKIRRGALLMYMADKKQNASGRQHAGVQQADGQGKHAPAGKGRLRSCKYAAFNAL